MKKANLLCLVLCCATLILGLSILGCGNEGDGLITTDGDEAAILANACGETCNTLVSCAELPDDAVDDNLQTCNDSCFSPPREDIEMRDCSLECDLTLECGLYMLCLCNCGLDEVCVQ